jgi:tetratricopeptide (TPR) repeat protein
MRASLARPDTAVVVAGPKLRYGRRISVLTDRTSGPMARVPQCEIERQLERILADPLFQASPRLSRFLSFTVGRVLADDSDELKEFVIGVEVFNRDATFSPQEDPIVRVIAGRLRGKLAEYYNGPGRGDPIILEMPRGGYVPQFRWREPPTSPNHAAAPGTLPLRVSQAVGREKDLSQLRSAFASVCEGRGSVIMISGEAGIGKTTVVEEFLSELESERVRARVARGRCSERLAETDAFTPILEVLEFLIQGEGGDEARDLMKRMAPSWYVQVRPINSDTGDLLKEAQTASYERMRRELRSFFEGMSRTRPILLFLDDLHWADASTCDLLAYLASRMPQIRLLLVGAYRPGLVLTGNHPFLALKVQLNRGDAYREIPLAFLGLNDIRRYLNMQFPGNAYPEGLARVVHERTEGSPLFMRDMLRFLSSGEFLVEREGKWVLDKDLSEVRRVIPVGIHSMIALKISQLKKEDQQILHCAAVQGMQFDSAVAAVVLNCDPAALEERLHELDTIHDFIRLVNEAEFPDGSLSLRYRFVHVFYQNALAALAAPSRRAEHSLAIGNALVRFTGDFSPWIAADLAVLFEAGRDFSSAAQYFLQAARNAARVFAYPEAVLLCDRGLKSLARLPESPNRDAQELILSLTQGIALMSTRGYAAPEVEKTHERSRDLCIKLNEPRRLLSVLWGLHTCHTNRGDLERALQVAREMRQVADSLAEPIAVIESLHAFGTTLAFMGRLTEAQEAFDLIFKTYPVSEHVFHGSLYVLDPCVTSLSMLARLLAMMGYLEQALEKARASVDLANRLAHPPSLAYAIFWVGWIHHTRSEYAASLPHLESAMELSRKHDLRLFLEWGRIVRGAVLTRTGAPAEGVSEIRKSIAHQTAMGAMLERSYCLTLLAEALGAEGACEEALGLCDQALEFANSTGGRCYQPETHRVRGEMLLALGEDSRLDEVRSAFECARCMARDSAARLLELRAVVSQFRFCRRLGEHSRGRALLSETLAWFTEGLDSPLLSDARRLLTE